MKKVMVLGAALCVAMLFTGCKSNESAYKKAYERAKAQETSAVTQQTETYVPQVTQTVERPATETSVYDNTDNAVVRQEKVSIIDGAGLSDFSVVVGSFSVRANAEGLQNRMRSAGYDAQLGYNSERNMYRVIASTFANKTDAVRSRDQLRSQYPDAWLLFAK